MTNVDGFAAHNIDHLSASSLNSAATCLPVWLMERLLGKKVPVGAAAHRGTAIEEGIVSGLIDPTKEVAECQRFALTRFDSLTAFLPDPNKDKERQAVEPTVALGLAELRQYGIPDEVQQRIEKPLGNGLPPLIGFADLGWSAHAITLDIKTSLRLTSEISPSHGRQVAGYVFGTNREGRVAYFTPKKAGIYQLDRIDERFAELVNIAQRLGKFLAVSNDPWELAGMLIPDPTHYFFNNPAAEAARIEVFGY